MDVARILGRKPHQIVYTLTTRQVPEPTRRVANERVFSVEDVERLARHFHVIPPWSVVEHTDGGNETEASSPRLTLKRCVEVVSAGDGVHEVRDGQGEVFARCRHRGKAFLIAGLLESACRS
jgi:hypothetical protein